MTGPSTTLDQMSSAMSDWSKILNPKKLNLGISSDIIVELTVPVKDSLSINGTVPRDVNATIPSNVFVPYNDSARDSYLKPYTDRCTFKENDSLGVGSCFTIRSANGPLYDSCTSSNSNWTRVFDVSYNATFLYSLYNTSLVIGSPTPLSRYYYVTYEDYQSIQYKLKLIIDNKYGGISFSSLTDGCDDLMNVVMSIFPITGYSPPHITHSFGYPSPTVLLYRRWDKYHLYHLFNCPKLFQSRRLFFFPKPHHILQTMNKYNFKLM